MHTSNICRRWLLAAMLAGLLFGAPSFAQSDAPSEASALSMEPSAASAVATLELLPAGAHLIVTGLRPVGDMIEISAETTGHVAVTGLCVSAAIARRAGLSVGTAMAVTMVASGWIVSQAGEEIAFLPDRLARSLMHHRAL